MASLVHCCWLEALPLLVSKCRNLLAHPYFPGEPEQRGTRTWFLVSVRGVATLSLPVGAVVPGLLQGGCCARLR